jgi:hypothetical protein
MTKVHFVEGDTDSMYMAVAGNPNDDCHQGFKYVIKNKEYYDKYVYKWLPDPNKDIDDEKKLLGAAIEKEGYLMIAIAPKCYYLKTTRPTERQQTEAKKMKGVSVGLNPDITLESYKSCIEQSIPKQGYNRGFKIILSDVKSHKYEMIKYKQ